MKQLLVALLFALLAAVATGTVLRHRDALFEHDWARPHGALESNVSPALLESAAGVAEAENPGKTCVVEPLVRDDRYLYVGLGCARFGGTPEGDQDLLAARFRYSGDRASSLDRADPEAYGNSVHRLFPRAVYEKFRAGLARSDYLAAGLARARRR